MKTIAVHIVTYNSERDIANCLDAVFQQTYPINQVIVVDNDSKDSTRAILEGYNGRITTIYNAFNNGFSGAHNQALSYSQADYCLILNPDVTLHPDYLRELMNYAISEHGVKLGSLTGKLLLKSDPGRVDSCGLRINKARRAFDMGVGDPSDEWSEILPVFGVSGAAALYRRAMIDSISYEGEFFDNSFFAYKEDVDVAWRAQLFGWEAIFIPQAVAYHERGWKTGGRKNQSVFVRKLSYINRYKMIIKNDRFFSICKYLVPFLLYECLSLGYVLLREPRLVSSWITIFKGWGRLKKWRLFIHSHSGQNTHKIYSFFKQ